MFTQAVRQASGAYDSEHKNNLNRSLHQGWQSKGETARSKEHLMKGIHSRDLKKQKVGHEHLISTLQDILAGRKLKLND